MSEDDPSSKNTPSKAMMIMLAPDGYYTYLNIPRARNTSSSVDKETSEDEIDLDLVKRNYRKLSIRVRTNF